MPRSRVDRTQWQKSWKKLNGKQKAEYIRSLSPEEYEEFEKTWAFYARPEQVWPEGNWHIWIVDAGRGWGKTRTGSENVKDAVESGGYGEIGFVGHRSADVRDVMVEGPSGILEVSHKDFRPNYEPSKRKVTWNNGATAHCYSVHEERDIEMLRGPQHDLVWLDEFGKWKNQEYAWDMIMMGLRVGESPKAIITTTPRMSPKLKELIELSKKPDSGVILTGGSTYDNLDNLSPIFRQTVLEKYEGTRIGRQEIYAELLEDVPGALWTLSIIEKWRADIHPELKRIVVAIDPNVTSSETADEVGIVTAGLGSLGGEDHAWILNDLSGKFGPLEWAKKAVNEYHVQQADRIIGETNNGGELVEINIRTVDPNVSYKSVHASRGKRTRAEPVAALYEQGKVHHVGIHPQLEDQLTMHDFTSGEKSPDRLDALVWAVTELMLEDTGDLVFG